MQLLQVQVPAGVYVGQQFRIQVGAQVMTVACPAGAGPGQMIQIQVPVAGPPPGPQPGSAAHMFRLIDTDRSGSLASHELQTALSGVGGRGGTKVSEGVRCIGV